VRVIKANYVVSKWVKHLVLLKSKELLPILPKTMKFSWENLSDMINKYNTIYLKPEYGTGGYGILKVTKNNDKYLLQFGQVKKENLSYGELEFKLKKWIEVKPYLIQQGISLISWQNRLYDFRVLLLKPEDKWLNMGIMGKWASKDKIVTNKTQGGKAITFSSALKNSTMLKDEEIFALEKKILALGNLVANELNKQLINLKELGLDFAIDNNLNIWLLEANTKPRYNLFRYHPDKLRYETIAKTVYMIRKKILSSQ